MTRRKILFLATEDWFVCSHFLPLIRRSLAEGFEPIVAARMGEAMPRLVAEGARTIDLPDERGVYGLRALISSVRRLRSVLERERPDVVHAIALRPILVASLAAIGAPRAAHVLAVTGRGYLAMNPSWRARRALDLVATLIARRVRADRAVLVVENDDDARWVGGRWGLPEERVVISPGAGVELDLYPPAPEPAAPPIRIGFVSRLVRSKGADVAVEAVRRLREGGLDVTLTIAGAPDFDNPAAVTEAELQAWQAISGVEVIGRIRDVAGFWAGKHIACLPSRGGEGLPRSLLEAGACARPLITTAVAGCRDYAIHGVSGLLVRRDDPDALARAIEQLARDPDLRWRLGQAARARTAAGFTTDHAADRMAQAWRQALGAQAPASADLALAAAAAPRLSPGWHGPRSAIAGWWTRK